MKNILLALALISPAAFAANEPGVTETAVGCMYNHEKASCVVENKSNVTKTCDVKLFAVASGVTKLHKTTVVIYPHRYETLKVLGNLEEVSGTAQCR